MIPSPHRAATANTSVRLLKRDFMTSDPFEGFIYSLAELSAGHSAAASLRRPVGCNDMLSWGHSRGDGDPRRSLCSWRDDLEPHGKHRRPNAPWLASAPRRVRMGARRRQPTG